MRLVSADRRAVLARRGTRAPGRVDLPEQLERLALMSMTRHEQLATDWVDESQHGGMLLAVLGHLDDADRRTSWPAWRPPGDAAYAVVLDVATWDRGGRRAHHRHRRPAQRRLEGRDARPRRLARAPPGWSWRR